MLQTSIRLKNSLFILFFVSTCTIMAQAQMSSSSEIQLGLQKLNTLGSVLYIAAHPDDENTRLLAYLAKERKMRTAYLSLTRGDGGQNLIGSEQGDMLGLIRTEELLAARRIDGAEQFFTRAVDFGYSKTPDETFSIWNKSSILSDVVYAIRKFRPDVIICRFPTTGEGGHGHHTASAILAVEAFDLATDPNAFPEQLSEVSVWQPKRLFWNTFNFGTTNTTSESQLKIDIGNYNPLLGMGYGEIAAMSRSMHKSQGFGSAATRGSMLEYFKLLKGDSAKNDLFDGVVTNWSRLPNTSKIAAAIKKLNDNFKGQAPQASVKELLNLRNLLNAYNSNDPGAKWYVSQKLKEVEHLLVMAMGLWVETTASDYQIIPGKMSEWNTQVILRSATNVKLVSVNLAGISDTLPNSNLEINKAFALKRKMSMPENTNFSEPYWLSNAHEPGTYYVGKTSLIGTPVNPPIFEITYTFEIDGEKLQITKPLAYKSVDPVKGEVYRPIEVLPAVSVTPMQSLIVFKKDEVKSVFFTVKANTDNVKGKFALIPDENIRFTIYQPDIELKKKNDEVVIEVRVSLLNPGFSGNLNAYVKVNGIDFNKSIQRINYDHIPYRFKLEQASIHVLNLDIQMTKARIGYIKGAGDEVPESLMQLGYKVEMLSNEMLKNSDLSVYDAIITGVRAFNTNDQLGLYQNRLSEYVGNGGRFIVQYNTNSRVGPINTGIGPYKFTITRNRVTDEKSKVVFLNDTIGLLKYPNPITEADFNGWVQERGIYFAGDIDSNYVKVFAMNDPGEKSDQGSLIMARYGKGYFVYTGLAFFRQLPAGVPGAYRLFVNIISQPVGRP